MAFEKLSDSVHELNNNFQSYIQSNSDYYRLKAFRQGMQGATALVRFLIMACLLSVAGVMLSFAFAIVISQAIGIPSSGYFIVGGFYIVVFILIYIFGKEPIQKLIIKKFSKTVFTENQD